MFAINTYVYLRFIATPALFLEKILKCSNFVPDCLCVIASRQNKEVAKAKLIKELVMVSCEYFFQYASRTLYLTSAENLVRVMQALSNFLPAEAEPKRKLGV